MVYAERKTALGLEDLAMRCEIRRAADEGIRNLAVLHTLEGMLVEIGVYKRAILHVISSAPPEEDSPAGITLGNETENGVAITIRGKRDSRCYDCILCLPPTIGWSNVRLRTELALLLQIPVALPAKESCTWSCVSREKRKEPANAGPEPAVQAANGRRVPRPVTVADVYFVLNETAWLERLLYHPAK